MNPGTDLQTILEGLLESLSEQHVCDDDCRAGGCDRDGDEDWKDEFDGDGALADCQITTFEAGGYLTRDAGLVVRLADGSEFQVTIVQTPPRRRRTGVAPKRANSARSPGA